MRNYLSLIILILLLAFNCCDKVEDNHIDPDSKGGIVITFDDDYIDLWYIADSLLRNYNWNATFCISYYDRLTAKDIERLHAFKSSGHEIAGHGLNHLNAIEISADSGIETYLNQEIIPMIDIMENDSFSVKSFAYPFGRRTEDTDEALLDYFDIIRGVGWGGYNKLSEHNCFFNNSQLVYGIGIDRHFGYYTDQYYEEYILDLLSYARDNDKILIVFGHKTVESITDDYQVSISTLEMICNFIEGNDMKYYTLSELKDLIN